MKFYANLKKLKIEKFNIYKADLNPQFGTEPGKIRPVVVIQTNLLNNVHLSTIVCPITSKITQQSKILRVHLDHPMNELNVPSDILVDQVRAIDNKRLVEKMGKLTPSQAKQLTENLNIIFD